MGFNIRAELIAWPVKRVRLKSLMLGQVSFVLHCSVYFFVLRAFGHIADSNSESFVIVCVSFDP